MSETAVMAVRRLEELNEAERGRIIRRAGANSGDASAAAREIVREVRKSGDGAVRRYTAEHDKARIEALEVAPEEIRRADDRIGKRLMLALRKAHSNILRFHSSQLQPQPVVENGEGVRVWREWRAIERVGIYVPGGSALYPSSVLMNAVPAAVAGCREVMMCTPPRSDGTIAPALLAAARLAGVSRVFRIGGAQAIAALAYGTESVPRVYKIFGAGNPYVTAAKMLVFGDVDIDLPAGPSEILIVADDSADPTTIAWDLMAQSEHREDSASVLLTDSPELAGSVVGEIERLADGVESAHRIRRSFEAFGAILLASSLEEAVAFANEYAPEHLQIATSDPESVLRSITNAGSVFLGHHTPVPCGDYATGGNHVLPTGGHARTFGPLSVEAFGRWMQVQTLSRNGLEDLADTVVALAEAEGLPAHAKTVESRLAR